MATPTTLPATFVAGNVLTAAQMNNLRGAFRVLQVVSTAKTDVFTTTSGTFTDITGLSATITPSSTASKIFVAVTMPMLASSANVSIRGRVVRGATAVFIGDASAGKTQTTFRYVEGGTTVNSAWAFLDSPATTSATTYQVQANIDAGFVFYLNRDRGDAERGAASITVMEISA